LERLNLNHTPVSDAGLAHLAALPNLRELRLDSATVTDAGLEVLKSLDSLEVVDLYHTLVTEGGLEKLQSILPQCRIIWDRDSGLSNRRGS